MAGKGFTDKGNRITPTSPFDWDTGAKLSAGEGAGTSDTTEATQLLVKTAVETTATNSTALAKSEDAAHASGDKGIMALVVRKDTAAALAGADGDYAPLEVDASGRLWVNVGTMAALPAGSNAIGSVVSAGNVAHDAADSGNPLKVGGKAYTSAPAAVADGDRVDQAMTLRGAAHAVFVRTDGTVVDPDEAAEVALTKSTAYFNAAAGSTKYLVATGAQVLTDYFIENPDAAAKGYLQFFNAASTAAVTLGTTAPVRSIGLAAGEKANLSGLAVDFPLGLVIAGTTTATGSTTATTGLVVNLGHKAG